MKLIEAIKLVRAMGADAEAKSGFLACGFTPLHLETFLKAELFEQHGFVADLQIGVFDDLAGNIRRSVENGSDFGFVMIEWPDLDPRLSVRASARHHVDLALDIEDTVQRRLEQLEDSIKAAPNIPFVISLPSLPLSQPIPVCRPKANPSSFALHAMVAQLAASIAKLPNVRVLDPAFLGELVLPADRYDIREHLRSGFPYKLSFCSELAKQLAGLYRLPPRKKGLITDLDNTLWRGVVGDEGVDAVSWNLDHKSQPHALYQQCLSSLAASGILLAVASKNSEEIAVSALNREDMLLSPDAFFPMEIHWEPKSQSVGRILQAWNIGPSDVVFVDDSSLELSEVSSAWPELTCLQFPTAEEAGVVSLIQQLGDLFAKEQIRDEDRLRAQSIRSNAAFQANRKRDPEELLSGLDAKITLTINQPDQRCFELINKTNQFNLNGRRINEVDWDRYTKQENTFVVSAKYEDRLGLLGTIGVIAGTIDANNEATIDHWVLSCRAFSRRIEFQLLQSVFDEFELSAVCLDFQSTDRNEPIRRLLHSLIGETLSQTNQLSLDTLRDNSPPLYAGVIKT